MKFWSIGGLAALIELISRGRDRSALEQGPGREHSAVYKGGFFLEQDVCQCLLSGTCHS